MSYRDLVRAATCVLALVVMLHQPVQAQLRAGAAKVDITPDVKASHIPLGGYAARRAAPATGVHDPVYARALVLDDGAHKAALVSVDLCFAPANLKADVQEKLKAAGVTGFEGAGLFLVATHTHSGPDPLAMHAQNHFVAPGWSAYDPNLREFTTRRIADAVVAADRALAPARIGSLQEADHDALNRNRRHDPAVDSTFTVVRVVGEDGKPIGEIVDFASHPTLYGDDMREVSADWPGVTEATIDDRLHGGVCLFFNGALGDASPNGVDDVKGDEKVKVYGDRVAKAALDRLDRVTPLPAVTVATWSQDVPLPPRKPNGFFFLAAGQLGLDMRAARGLVNDLMPTSTHLSFVKIGDALLMGFPCEPSGALGMEAEATARAAGVKVPVVVGLTNEWLAYALTPTQYRAGKYEAMMSFYGDQFGPALMAGLKQGLAKVP
jgi:hypothetical protein